jgi:hypothetical protein
MSQDEEIGKLVTDYSRDIEYQKNLKEKTQLVIKLLQELSAAIHHRTENILVEGKEFLISQQQGHTTLRIPFSIINPDAIADLLRELEETKNRLTQIKMKLRNLGISNLPGERE